MRDVHSGHHLHSRAPVVCKYLDVRRRRAPLLLTNANVRKGTGANFSRHSPATVDTHKAPRGPLVLTSGTDDHTVPLKVTKEAFAMYSDGPADTEFHLFEGRGHALTMDHGWEEVAEIALKWFDSKGF